MSFSAKSRNTWEREGKYYRATNFFKFTFPPTQTSWNQKKIGQCTCCLRFRGSSERTSFLSLRIISVAFIRLCNSSWLLAPWYNPKVPWRWRDILRWFKKKAQLLHNKLLLKEKSLFLTPLQYLLPYSWTFLYTFGYKASSCRIQANST